MQMQRMGLIIILCININVPMNTALKFDTKADANVDMKPKYGHMHAVKDSHFDYKQECIPAGCVPAARRPYAGVYVPGGGVSAPGGVCSRGGSAPGGVSQHALRQTPPVNRMTDRCKNITLATTSLRPVMSDKDQWQIQRGGEVNGSGWEGLHSHTRSGGRLGGLAGGSPDPNLEGCIPACLRQTPSADGYCFGRILLKSILVLQDFCQKLHENGSNWTGGGAPRLDSPMQTIFQPKCYVST